MLRRFFEEIQNVSRVVPLSTTCRYLACVAGSVPTLVGARKLWPADLKMRGHVKVRYEHRSEHRLRPFGPDCDRTNLLDFFRDSRNVCAQRLSDRKSTRLNSSHLGISYA